MFRTAFRASSIFFGIYPQLWKITSFEDGCEFQKQNIKTKQNPENLNHSWSFGARASQSSWMIPLEAKRKQKAINVIKSHKRL